MKQVSTVWTQNLISLIKGKLQVDMFSKPTNAHLYSLPTSNHLKETTRNILYGVGLRIHRNCSEDTQIKAVTSCSTHNIDQQETDG